MGERQPTRTRFTSNPQMTLQNDICGMRLHPFSLPEKSLYFYVLIVDKCSLNVDNCWP